MIPEFDAERRTLTVDNQVFDVSQRKRVRGYEYFKLADGRNIISNGQIFLFTPTSSYGVRQLHYYECRPPLPREINADSQIESLEDGLEIYRGITGACDGGVEAFLNNLVLPPFPAPISLLILLTKGLFGSDIVQEHVHPTGKRLFFGSQNKDGLIIPSAYQRRIPYEDLIKAEIQAATGRLKEIENV
jgi:hypothetical protein